MRKSLLACASIAAAALAIPTVAQAQSSLGSLGTLVPPPPTSVTPPPVTTTPTGPEPEEPPTPPVPMVWVVEQDCALTVRANVAKSLAAPVFTNDEAIVLVEPATIKYHEEGALGWQAWVEIEGVVTTDYRSTMNGTIDVRHTHEQPFVGEPTFGVHRERIAISLPQDQSCSTAPRALNATIEYLE